MLYSMKNNQQNHIGMFLYLTQVKAALLLLFQLLLIIDFLASPLSKSHVVVTVSNSNTENTGVCQIDLATYKEAHRVRIP